LVGVVKLADVNLNQSELTDDGAMRLQKRAMNSEYCFGNMGLSQPYGARRHHG